MGLQDLQGCYSGHSGIHCGASLLQYLCDFKQLVLINHLELKLKTKPHTSNDTLADVTSAVPGTSIPFVCEASRRSAKKKIVLETRSQKIEKGASRGELKAGQTSSLKAVARIRNGTTVTYCRRTARCRVGSGRVLLRNTDSSQ